MAVYTIENTVKIGKPCRVIDGDGHEVKRCTYCNDVTGEIERHATDASGRPILDESRCDVVRIQETRPLPIKVELL